MSVRPVATDRLETVDREEERTWIHITRLTFACARHGGRFLPDLLVRSCSVDRLSCVARWRPLRVASRLQTGSLCSAPLNRRRLRREKEEMRRKSKSSSVDFRWNVTTLGRAVSPHQTPPKVQHRHQRHRAHVAWHGVGSSGPWSRVVWCPQERTRRRLSLRFAMGFPLLSLAFPCFPWSGDHPLLLLLAVGGGERMMVARRMDRLGCFHVSRFA
jgi:hypothetical protein